MIRLIFLICFIFVNSGLVFSDDDLSRTSPLYSEYNTFIKATNVLELVSVGTSTANVKVSFYQIDGTFQKAVRVDIPALSQLDLDVNTLVGKTNTYGIMKVEFNNSTAKLQGRTSIYRLEDAGTDYSFAYALPLRTPLMGTNYLTSNTYDPQGRGFVVPNWVSLTNLAETSEIFTYNIYDQSGSLLRTEAITLAPQERRDVAGNIGSQEQVFLNEIIPPTSTTPYLASVIRYASNTKPGGNFSSYLYAMPIFASSGAGATQFMPISNQSGDCYKQSNWVEVLNVDTSTANFVLNFRKEDGTSVGSTNFALQAKEQFHFNADTLLDLKNGKHGMVSLEPVVGDKIVAQSVVYYHDCKSNVLQSAYNIAGKTPSSLSPFVSSFNRFLSMENELFILNASGTARTVGLTLRESGNTIHTSSFSIPFYGTTNKSLNASTFGTSADTYGIIQVTSSVSTPITGYNLRVRKTGTGNKTIDYSVPVELR